MRAASNALAYPFAKDTSAPTLSIKRITSRPRNLSGREGCKGCGGPQGFEHSYLLLALLQESQESGGHIAVGMAPLAVGV